MTDKNKVIAPTRKKALDWAKEKGSRRSTVAGAAALLGWKTDRLLTEKEFSAGLEKFTKKPLGAGNKKENKR